MSFIQFHQISRNITQLFLQSSQKCLSTTRYLTKETSSSKKCKKKSPFIVCQAEAEEFPKILSIMEKNYFREEPPMKFFGLKLNPTIEAYTTVKLNEGISLMAKCKYTGQILGIALNATTKPWQSHLILKLAEKQGCPETVKLLMFYAFLERKHKLFEKYPNVSEMFTTKKVFIDKKERKYGLEEQLMKACINEAIDKQYKIMRCDATNITSSEVMEKMNFKLEMTIPFESYKDENGKHVFKNIGPNIGTKIYTLDLVGLEKFDL